MRRKVHSIKFFDEEWEEIEAMADAEGKTASTFVREASLTGMAGDATRQQRKSAIAELVVVGGRLKELRRDLEREGYEHDSVAVGRLLDHARETIDRLGGYAVVGMPEDEESAPDVPLSDQEPSGS